MAPAAWQAAAAAVGAPAGQVRLVQAWQWLRPALLTAARGAVWAIKAAVWLRCHYFCAGLACLVWVDGARMPQVQKQLQLQLQGVQLAPPTQRMRAFAAYAAGRLSKHLVLQYLILRDWRAVLRTGSWRLAARLALACGVAAACAALQQYTATPWNAPGAPPREPPPAALAESLARLSLLVAACFAVWIPANDLAILGPLAPAWIAPGVQAGYSLSKLALAMAREDAALAKLASDVHLLFAQRPSALHALRKVLL